ncbi:MAG TPA: hypothetical protein VK907_11450, partial [Phnomibacter sp.]|nr:hypothetical protein [Phnomibacter sp.]
MTEDGHGGVLLAWTDPRDNATNSNDIYVQRINGSGEPVWTLNGVAVAANPGSELQPSIVAVSMDRAAVVWRFTGTGTDLAMNFLNLANGSKVLVSDVVVNAEANNQTNQQVAADGSGGVIVVWTDGRVTNATSGIVAQRINQEGAKMWLETGAMVRTPGGTNTTAPQLVADGTGGAVFAWSDSRNGPTNADIYAQYFNENGESQWGTAGIGLQVTGASGLQTNPSIIRSGANYIIGWSDQQNGGAGNTDVYAQAYNAGGTALWNGGQPFAVVDIADQQPLANTAPTMVADGSGGAIFIWDDRRFTSTNTDIYAQYVTAAGAKQWAENGAAVATREGSNQNTAMAVASSDNGIIVAWRDSRTNANAEIFASRLQRDGLLPVNILELGAQAIGKQVEVRWTSANERALQRFEVERSADGMVFEMAGTVAARNAPGTHQYRFDDLRPISGQSFYRIRSIDTDGKTAFSNVARVSIVFAAEGNLHIYPNPAVATANLQLNDVPAGSYSIRMID